MRSKYFIVLFLGFILVFYIKINPSNYYETLKTIKLTKQNYFEKNIIDKVTKDESESLKAQKDIDSLFKEWNALNTLASTNNITEQIDTSIVIDEHKITNSIESSVIEKKKLIEEEGIKQQMSVIWKQRDSLRISAENDSLYKDIQMFDIDRTPGMFISIKQTKLSLENNPKALLIGHGTGNFSSSLAFMSSKEGTSSRLFNYLLPKYEHPEFTNNHKAIWKFVDYKGVDYHSIKHMPFNTYNTLIGEYGLLGLSCFFTLYIIPVAVKLRKKAMLIFILIPLFLMLLAFNYWFETLTFIVFFEIVIYNEIKNNLIPTK